ncbi:MAG: peptide chain release factor N(5)-glutamine methyltransferase [Acidimicrobiales bacterium]
MTTPPSDPGRPDPDGPDLDGPDLEGPDLEGPDLEGTVTWAELQREAERRLAEAGLPSAAKDARRIVERAGGFEGADYVLGLGERATTRSVAWFDAMVERRLGGEPLQYVLGVWGFRTLDLLVDRRVLIPRPETEEVAGWALAELDRLRADVASGGAGGGGRPLVAVDLGTGSGAIALSLVAERRDVEVWATDVSPDALDVASANLAGLGGPARRVTLAEGSWFGALPSELRGRIDLVVSNPPYVAATDDLPAEVADWEPPGALVPGPTGLESLLLIVGEAPGWLTRPAGLVVELAPGQAEAVAAAARAAGFVEARVETDLSGRDRAVVARI